MDGDNCCCCCCWNWIWCGKWAWIICSCECIILFDNWTAAEPAGFDVKLPRRILLFVWPASAVVAATLRSWFAIDDRDVISPPERELLCMLLECCPGRTIVAAVDTVRLVLAVSPRLFEGDSDCAMELARFFRFEARTRELS